LLFLPEEFYFIIITHSIPPLHGGGGEGETFMVSLAVDVSPIMQICSDLGPMTPAERVTPARSEAMDVKRVDACLKFLPHESKDL